MDIYDKRRVDDYLGTEAQTLRVRGLDRTPMAPADKAWPGELSGPERIFAILGVPVDQRAQLIAEMSDEEILAFPRPAEPGPFRERWVAAHTRRVLADE